MHRHRIRRSRSLITLPVRARVGGGVGPIAAAPPESPHGIPQIGIGRRALDIAAAGTALLLLGPVLLAVAIAVRATGHGPAWFHQTRIGEGGRPFIIYKLRSMRPDPAGPAVTTRHDPRITRMGTLLRRTHLDELPQLLNVLAGQMTLVGPRPEAPGLAARYPAECRWILAHRPGLTGPTQVQLRHLVAPPAGIADPEGHYLTVIVPQRVRCDAQFLHDPSVGRVLALLAQTVLCLLLPDPLLDVLYGHPPAPAHPAQAGETDATRAS